MSQDLNLPKPVIVYASKRDWWLILLVGLAMAMLILSGVKLLDHPPPQNLSGVACFLAATFLLWVLQGTWYAILTDRLLIVSACFRWQIPLDQITAISPTRNPLSSPALSLDRLSIQYQSGERRRWVMISPVEQERFLHELKLVAPWIRMHFPG